MSKIRTHVIDELARNDQRRGQLLNRSFWLHLPRRPLLCRLLGHRPVVDGHDSGTRRVRWVACDQCGLRPQPQHADGDLQIGQPYTDPLPGPWATDCVGIIGGHQTRHPRQQPVLGPVGQGRPVVPRRSQVDERQPQPERPRPRSRPQAVQLRNPQRPSRRRHPHARRRLGDLVDGGTFLEYVGVALALAMATAVPLAAWNYTDKRSLDRTGGAS